MFQKGITQILLLGLIAALLIAGLSFGYDKYIKPGQDIKVNTNNSADDIDLEAFKAVARKASCADKRNDLYLIDGQEVFWAREGGCPDSSYAYILFGQTPNEILCSRSDSLMGPQEKCNDAANEDIFLLVNPEDVQLGLKKPHSLKQFYPEEKNITLP